jgi:DNA-directed RNA polymerase subunit beta
MPDTLPVISFSSMHGAMDMPHLLDIQTKAFASLLVPDDVEGDRQDVSLERVFRDLFPISDVNGKYSLEFVSYGLGEPKYSVEECIERADQALMLAKAAGRNRAISWDPAVTTGTRLRRLEIHDIAG